MNTKPHMHYRIGGGVEVVYGSGFFFSLNLTTKIAPNQPTNQPKSNTTVFIFDAAIKNIFYL